MVVNDFVIKIKLDLNQLSNGLKTAQDKITSFTREMDSPLDNILGNNNVDQTLKAYRNKVQDFWKSLNSSQVRFDMINTDEDIKAISTISRAIENAETKVKIEADTKEAYTGILSFKSKIAELRAILKINPDDHEAQAALNHLETKLDILEKEYKVKVSGDKLGNLEAQLNEIQAKKVIINGDSIRIKIDGSGFKGLLNELSQIGWAIQGIKGTMQAISNVTTPFIKPSADMEAYLTSFTVMLGSAEKAKERLNELTEFAKVTPFELPEVIDAGKQLQAVGKYSEETLRKLGDLASGAGKPFDQVLSAFSKLASGQKGIAVDMFRDLLISVDDWKKAGIRFNDSTGEMVSSTSEALTALEKIVQNKNFSGMMETQSTTLLGIISNLKDSLQGFLRWIGSSGLFEEIKTDFQSMLNWFNDNQSSISNFANLISSTIVFLIRAIKSIVTFIKDNYIIIISFALGLGTWAIAINSNIIGLELLALKLKAQIALTTTATAVQAGLNTAMKANPYMLITGALFVLGGVIAQIINKNRTLNSELSQNNDITNSTKKQVLEFERLTSRYETLRKSESLSKGDKIALNNVINELNQKYSKYLGNIDLSTAKYKDYKKAINQARQALIDEASTKYLIEKKQDKLDQWGKLEDEKNTEIDKIYGEVKWLYKQKSQLKEQLKTETDDLLLGNITRTIKTIDDQFKILLSPKQVQEKYDQARHIETIYNKKKEALLNEINSLESKYKSLFDTKTTPNPPDKSTKQAFEQKLETLRSSMQSAEDKLQKDYVNSMSDLKKNYAEKSKEFAEKKLIIDQWYDSEKAKLNQEKLKNEDDTFKAEIDFMSKKKDLGILNYQELKSKVEEYYSWVKSKYGEDSAEAIQALEMKKKANEQYQEDIKTSNEKTLSELNEAIARSEELYKNGFIPYQTVLNLYDTSGEEIQKLGLNIYDLMDAMEGLNEKREEFVKSNSFTESLKRQEEEIQSMGDTMNAVYSSISGGMKSALDQMLIEGKNSTTYLTTLWKNMTSSIISYITNLIAKFVALKLLFLLFKISGMGPAGVMLNPISGTITSVGGNFPGTGSSDDSNITSSYSLINKVISSLNIPKLPIPSAETFGFSNGSMNTPITINVDSLEKQLIMMNERLERIERKEFSPVIKADGRVLAKVVNEVNNKITRSIS